MKGLGLLLLKKAMVVSAAEHSQTMSIPPETYAILLNHDYEHVREWALSGKLAPEIEGRLPLLEDNREMIVAWVHYNERHRKMLKGKKRNPHKPVLGYLEFGDQIGDCKRW